MTSANGSEGARGHALFRRPLECIGLWWECIVFGDNNQSPHRDAMKTFLTVKEEAITGEMNDKPYMKRWPVQKTTEANTKDKIDSLDAILDISKNLSNFCDSIIPDGFTSRHVKDMGVFCLKLIGLHGMLCAKIRNYKKGTHPALARSVVIHLNLRVLMVSGWRIDLEGIRTLLSEHRKDRIWVQLHGLLDSSNIDDWELPIKKLQDTFIQLLQYARNEEERSRRRTRLRDGEVARIAEMTSMMYSPPMKNHHSNRSRESRHENRELYAIPASSPPLLPHPFQPTVQSAPLRVTQFTKPPMQSYGVMSDRWPGPLGNWSGTSPTTSGAPSLRPPSTPSSVTSGSNMLSPEPSVHGIRHNQHRHTVLPSIPYDQPSLDYPQFGTDYSQQQQFVPSVGMKYFSYSIPPQGYFPEQMEDDGDIEMN